MKHGSLFSGIGGFDLAAEWMDWDNVFNCDIDPFCQKVLKYHFPNATQYTDIKQTDFTLWRGIDILTGGFPCQPFSAAGKRKGTEDDRHLWPEMLRVIREVQPRWVVGENVFGIINWSAGLVFEQVQADLEAEGYTVQAYVLPAVSVNAPHRRDRVWFVAHSEQQRHNGGMPAPQGQQHDGGREAWSEPAPPVKCGATSHPEPTGLEGRNELKEPIQSEQGSEEVAPHPCDSGDVINANSKRHASKEYREKESKLDTQNDTGCRWDNFPTVSPIRCKYDGVSDTMVRNIKSDVYATIRKVYTDKDLQEVWDAIQPEEVQRKVGRLYKIYDTALLFQVLQLCQTPNIAQGEFSPFGEKASEGLLRKMSEYDSFGCSPQGRELEKQFIGEFGNTMPQLSHEIALATKEIQDACAKFNSWHRNESIKAYGNAIVPQVALQIFKAIEQYETAR